VVIRRTGWIVGLGLLALLLAGCELFTTTPFPEFLAYTDISVDLAREIEEIWERPGEIDYQLDVVYSPTEEARVLLVVEPPTDQDGGFEYKGRLLIFDEDLDLIAEVRPKSDFDFFARPYAYGHTAGIMLISNMLITAAGQLFDVSLTYQGLEGPAIVDPGSATYLFAPPPGDFATYEIRQQGYTGLAVFPGDVNLWSFAALVTFPIVPPGAQSSDDDAGYQILDVVYNGLAGPNDDVTFLLSEPSEGRVVAARRKLSDISGGSTTELVSGSFPIEIEADRPLDYHADADGFFLRRRDGLLERHNWTVSGALELTGGGKTLVGDRYFARKYAFLSGATLSGNEYMYRFDPSSRVLTRYTRWW
jgi:hypothetical protein